MTEISELEQGMVSHNVADDRKTGAHEFNAQLEAEASEAAGRGSLEQRGFPKKGLIGRSKYVAAAVTGAAVSTAVAIGSPQ